MRSVRLILMALVAIVFLSTIATAMASSPISVNVKVTYSNDTPASGAVITLQNGNFTDFYIAITDVSGTCSLTNVRPNSTALRAHVATGSGSTAFNVTSVWYEAQNVTNINIKLPDSGAVDGQVRLDGTSANGSIVVLDDSATYTAGLEDGRFSFIAPAGNHSLYAAYYVNGIIYISDERQINVKPSFDEAYVLELKPASENMSTLPRLLYNKLLNDHGTTGPISLGGNLLGADGAPITNATIIAESYFKEQAGSTTTGLNGTFAFSGIRIGTDIVRFKVSVRDNGTDYSSYTGFYPAVDTSDMTVQISNYPVSTHGYIYGIITMSKNWTNSTTLSGTVYLSNGMSQAVSSDRNFGQFFFTVPPGPYEIYAIYYNGSNRYLSDTQRVFVEASWTAASANPTLLIVKPNQIYWKELLIAILLGLLCLAATYVGLRKIR
ncbi:MAG TPA: carboxypeptidase-like regulatory domain-containing protein [Methanocellaceae archaeon]